MNTHARTEELDGIALAGLTAALTADAAGEELVLLHRTGRSDETAALLLRSHRDRIATSLGQQSQQDGTAGDDPDGRPLEEFATPHDGRSVDHE